MPTRSCGSASACNSATRSEGTDDQAGPEGPAPGAHDLAIHHDRRPEHSVAARVRRGPNAAQHLGGSGCATAIRALFAAADETPIGSLVRTAVLTGMRRGELLGLRWADVDLERGVLHVQQTAQRVTGQGVIYRQPKTRLSRRAIEISPDAVVVLRSHRKRQLEERLLAGPAYVDRDFVFASAVGTPLEAGTIARTWLRVLAAAGVGHVRWHDLRHAHASLLLRQGVHPNVVSERLGHASVAITLDTYSHVLPGLGAAAAAALDLALAEPELAEVR